MGKTKNHSIRFDEDKLNFFKSKNPSIEKEQKIVDYFLDEFWWKHHGKWITNDEIEKMPTNGRQFVNQKTDKTNETKIDKPQKGDAPDPSNKAAYLKWLKEN